jgi:hypothetical protein
MIKKVVGAIVMLFVMASIALMSCPVIAHPADGTVKYWSLIICGSGEPGSFPEDASYMYHIVKDHCDFDGVYYLHVNPSISGVDAEATKANVRSAITNWLATHSDADDIVFIYYTSHGGGYNTIEGLEGGRFDASGDEGDEHQENTIVMKCWQLNRLYDLDGDGTEDDLVRNLDADVYIDYDLNNDGTIDGDFRIMRDYDGDGSADDLSIDPDSDDQCDVAIDATMALTSDGEDTDNDGKIIGVDVNGDGDQNDWVGYDESMAVSGGTYWDDELADDLSALQYSRLIFIKQGCIDPPALKKAQELFVLHGCNAFDGVNLSCFSGGIIDDISAPDRIIMTVTNETWYSYGASDDAYSCWSGPFMNALHGEKTHSYNWGGCIFNEDPIQGVDADVNNDEHVSMKEAWDYAGDHDIARPPEIP